jgi:hypothetical protein
MRVSLEPRPGREPSFCNPDQALARRIYLDLTKSRSRKQGRARASQKLVTKTYRMPFDNSVL